MKRNEPVGVSKEKRLRKPAGKYFVHKKFRAGDDD
jgi:hypothetical protein